MSFLHVIGWKLKYGSRIQVNFPLGIEKVTIEIDRNARVNLGEKIQNRGCLYLGCKEEGILEVGAHCFFNTNTSITCMKNITIGEYCKFGNNLVIVDHDHNFKDGNVDGRKSDKEEFVKKDIVIGNGVWVGANCVILKGVNIGDGAVIGAGSIVREDVPVGALWGEEHRGRVIKTV